MEEAGAAAAENVRLRTAAGYWMHGRSLAELSRQARAQLLEAAQAWTAAYREASPPSLDPQGLIFLAGHQPELFHPGVWFKNFALGGLARRHAAAAVNLVIDSDTMKSTSLPTPCGSPDDPRREAVLFDRPDGRLPFEERRILDANLFAGFGRRTAQRIAPLIPDPLIRRFWPMVLRAGTARRSAGLLPGPGAAPVGGAVGIADARVAAERGLRQRALPLVPRPPGCRHRALSRLLQPGGARIPPGAIASATRPIPCPTLSPRACGLKPPSGFGRPSNRNAAGSLFAAAGREILVSDRAGQELRLSMTADGDATDAVARLMAWGRQGVKIRSAGAGHHPLGSPGPERSILPRHRRRQVRPGDRSIDRDILWSCAARHHGRFPPRCTCRSRGRRRAGNGFATFAANCAS